MLGSYETAKRWAGALAPKLAANDKTPREFYVRGPNGLIASGPFTREEAGSRALANALEYGGAWDVVRPEVDNKGPRTYVAPVVARFTDSLLGP